MTCWSNSGHLNDNVLITFLFKSEDVNSIYFVKKTVNNHFLFNRDHQDYLNTYVHLSKNRIS